MKNKYDRTKVEYVFWPRNQMQVHSCISDNHMSGWELKRLYRIASAEMKHEK